MPVAAFHGARPDEAGSRRAARLPVLLYHRVGPPSPGPHPELTVAPDRFVRQVEWLARKGYVGIPASRWLASRNEQASLPDKPILLTFDDGYADLVDHAFPVLARLGFGAVVFVITGLLGGVSPWDGARLMSADEVRSWASRGIEFGGHGRTHADLTTLSASEMAAEIVGSRDDLAALLGAPVRSFAYPDGRYNQAVRDRTGSAFDLAFTCEEGVNDLESDPLLLRRTMVQPDDSLLDLALRVRLGRSPFQPVRFQLGRLGRRLLPPRR